MFLSVLTILRTMLSYQTYNEKNWKRKVVTAVCFNWNSKIMGSISHWGKWKRSSIHRRLKFTSNSTSRQSEHTEHARTYNEAESKSVEFFESFTNTCWCFRFSSMCFDKGSIVPSTCRVFKIFSLFGGFVLYSLIQPHCWQGIAIDYRKMSFSHHWSRRCGRC